MFDSLGDIILWLLENSNCVMFTNLKYKWGFRLTNLNDGFKME